MRGAGSRDGTFGFSDYNGAATLAGDFNIFNNGNDPSAPLGTFYFTLTTDDGKGDSMYLTRFAPASVVPEPSLMIPLSIALLALVFVAHKRLARTNS